MAERRLSLLSNRDRALRAEALVFPYKERFPRLPIEAHICDAITDLLHFARSHGLNKNKILAAAEDEFRHELMDERSDMDEGMREAEQRYIAKRTAEKAAGRAALEQEKRG